MPVRPQRSRGSIETLPSGALHVKVYAGHDPVTKRRHYLTRRSRAARTRSDRRGRLASHCWPRSPSAGTRERKATVDQLLERYLDQFDGADSTKTLLAMVLWVVLSVLVERPG